MDELFKLLCWVLFAMMGFIMSDMYNGWDVGYFILSCLLSISLFISTIPFKVGKNLTELGHHFLRVLVLVFALFAVLALIKHLTGSMTYCLSLICVAGVIIYNYRASIVYIFERKHCIF